MEKLKDEHVGRNPDDLITPDFNVDVHAFDECCRFIDSNLPLLTDYKPNINELNEIENYFSGVYFHCLTEALRILNEMIELSDEDGMVGIELKTSGNTVAVFANTLDPQWVKIHNITFCAINST